MKEELIESLKGINFPINVLKFDDSETALLISINPNENQKEAWRLAMLLNAFPYKYFITPVEQDEKLTKIEFILEK